MFPIKTAGWDDENGEFDETLYLHLINLGWKVEEDLFEGKKDE